MANISVCMSICLLFVVAAFQPIAITVTLAEQQIPQTNTVKTQQNLVIKQIVFQHNNRTDRSCFGITHFATTFSHNFVSLCFIQANCTTFLPNIASYQVRAGGWYNSSNQTRFRCAITR